MTGQILIQSYPAPNTANMVAGQGITVSGNAVSVSYGVPSGVPRLGSDGTVGGVGGTSFTSPSGATSNTFGRTSTISNPTLRDYVSLLDYGVVNDAIRKTTGVVTSGVALLQDNSNPFTPSSVNSTITVYSGGANGGPLRTTITSYQTPGQVTLNAPANTTIGAATYIAGTLNTTNMQKAFDQADIYGFKLYAPTGGYLTGTINYRNQTIVGDSVTYTNFYGLPGQDVFHGDGTLTQFSRPGALLDQFTVWVDDSIDAVANNTFTTRNGIGNAGFAWDWANGANAAPLRPYEMTWGTIFFAGTTGVNYGYTPTSAAIYCQIPLNLSTVERWHVAQLPYGVWNDGPSSNIASKVVAGDHNNIKHFRSFGVNNPFRFFNDGYSHISVMAVHLGGISGLTLAGAASAGSRNGCAMVTIDDLYIENVSLRPLDWSNVDGVAVINGQIQGNAPTITISGSDVNWERLYLSTPTQVGPILTLAGNRIRIHALENLGNTTTPYGRDLVSNQGTGNLVVQSRVYGPRASNVNAREQLTVDSRIKHEPDILPVMYNQWGQYLNGNDLIINPDSMVQVGKTLGTDYTIQSDSSAIMGKSFTMLSTGSMSTGSSFFGQDALGAGTYAFNIGSLLPAGKVRCFIQAKAGTGGTQVWKVNVNGVSSGSSTLTWTTAYSIQSFDFDLTGHTSLDALQLASNAIGGGGATPLTIGGIAFMPYASNLLVAGSVGYPDPTQGQSGFYIPQRPNGTFNVTASGAYAVRFQAMNSYTIPHMAFVVTTSDSGGASDQMDIGIWDSTLTTVIGRSTIQTGNLVGGAVKTVALTAPPTLVAGNIYYGVIGFGSLTNTTGLSGYLYATTNATLMFGSAKGIAESLLFSGYTVGVTTDLSTAVGTGSVPAMAILTS